MNQMFYNCNNLKELNLSSFNTKNVKDMSQMFWDCHSLINLDFSSFDINNDTDINYIIFYCHNLKYIKIKEKYVNLISQTLESDDIIIIII